MADDIKGTLTNILKTMNSIDDLKKSINSLNDIKDTEINVNSNFDVKTIRNLEKLQATIISLTRAKEDLAEIEDESREAIKNNNKLTDEQIDRYDEASKSVDKYSKILVNAAKSQADAIDEVTKKGVAEKEIIMERWKQNTILGKSYSAVTGSVGKFAAGITAGTLAMKAIGRVADAATLRNNMMIASYGELEDSLGAAASETLTYEASLRKAESAAIRYGLVNENVSEIMLKYQRIVGDIGPTAMGSLTEATLAMAKVMNITGAEALKYVQDRVDKFGGSAANALSSLDDLRSETVRYNTELKGVKIRGDDVVRVIQDITNSNNVYAADQRFLSGVLTKTSATLQSQGESYSYAQRMAQNYTKALSSEAPEWMKISNAFDITDQVMGNTVDVDGVKKLTEGYAAELEKAKPGLSKKVNDLLNAGYNQYDTARLMGGLLQDTEAGMVLMNKKIVDLGRTSITSLAQAYNVSHVEAQSMLETAETALKDEKEKSKILNAQGEDRVKINKQMAAMLGMSEQRVEDMRKEEGYEKELVESFMKRRKENDLNRNIMERQRNAAAEELKVKKEIEKVEKELLGFQERGESASADIAEKKLKKLQEEKDRLHTEATGDTVGSTGILGALTKKVDEFQKATGLLNGDWIKSIFNDFSSPMVMGIGALGVTLWKGFGVSTRIEKWVEKIAYNTAGGGGFGGGGSSGGGIGNKKNRRNKWARASRKMGAKPRGVMGRVSRLAGGAKGILSKGGGLLKGIGGLGAMKGLGGILSKSKGLLKGVGGLAKKIPLLGTAISAMDMGSAYASGGTKGLAKSGIQNGGSMIGTALGGLVGSVIPGAGTLVGGMAGGFLGDYLGGIAADAYDSFTTSPDQIKTGLMNKNITKTPRPSEMSSSTANTSKSGDISSGEMVGNFGKMNPDGSITITVSNFMDAFAQSMSMAKKGKING